MAALAPADLRPAGSAALGAAAATVQGASRRGLDAESLFDDSVLQRLDLFVNARDWARLRAEFMLDRYYPASLTWRGQTVENVGIRSRGFGTRDGTKPGLRVDIDHYTMGQRFLGLRALVLDNLRQDPSGMHEALAMKLLATMGLPSVREAHTALYVNGTFAGVYAVVEPVDTVLVRRLFGAPGPVPSTPRARRGAGLEAEGFLFEYRWMFDYHAVDLGSALESYRALFDPKTHESDSLTTLYEPIRDLFRVVNEAPDEAFADVVGPRLDLELFVRLVAVQAYLAEWDGLLGYAGMNNFYLYRAPDGGPFHIVPWDEDNAFRAIDYPIDHGHEVNVLMRRAMAVPALRQLYVDTLLDAMRVAEAADPDGASWLEAEIGRRHQLIAAPMYEDVFKPFPNEEFEEAVALLGRFARERGAIVRALIAQLPG